MSMFRLLSSLYVPGPFFSGSRYGWYKTKVFFHRMALTPPKLQRDARFYNIIFSAVTRCYKSYGFFLTSSPSCANILGVVHMFWFSSYKVSKSRGSGDRHHCSDVLLTAFSKGSWPASCLICYCLLLMLISRLVAFDFSFVGKTR